MTREQEISDRLADAMGNEPVLSVDAFVSDGWGTDVSNMLFHAPADIAWLLGELKAERMRADRLSERVEHARALKAEAALSECQKECEEQARLNGMGASREARLIAQVQELNNSLSVQVSKCAALTEALEKARELIMRGMRGTALDCMDYALKAAAVRQWGK